MAAVELKRSEGYQVWIVECSSVDAPERDGKVPEYSRAYHDSSFIVLHLHCCHCIV